MFSAHSRLVHVLIKAIPLASRRGDRRVISNRFDMLSARRGKKTRLAHQAAKHVFLVGVKNRLMPREFDASLLPALGQ
jgi:hypothetical protein